MRIAVCADGNTVSPHFGRAFEYVIYGIDAGNVTSKERVASLGHDHEGVVDYLRGKEVSCLLGGGIGMGMRQMLGEEGIRVVGGFSCTTDEAVAAFLADRLPSTEGICDHQAHDGCEHHK